MANAGDFDITGSIRIIEKLKTELLKTIADLHESLLLGDDEGRTESLADLLILSYALAGRLGTSQKALDAKAIKQLKLELLNESNPMTRDFSAIMNHLEK